MNLDNTAESLPVQPMNELSVATPTFILTLIGVQYIAKGLIEIGQASEELLRGDRLPVLNFPTNAETAAGENKGEEL